MTTPGNYPEASQLVVSQSELRGIPAVSSLLQDARGLELSSRYGDGMFKYEARNVLQAIRRDLLKRRLDVAPSSKAVLEIIAENLERKRSVKARRAVNATGVLLHTNLGRAPIAPYAIEMLANTAGYGVVQVNIYDNTRSERDEEIALLLNALTGCEAATVVNNNAAATFMLLNTMAAGKEVIISRGQLVEIGGSYRMPDVMEQSGVILREVGTTNKTHLSDYARAISANTGALLYVEPSNYQVIGFAGFPGLAELCELGKQHNIPVIADLGSGALVPTERYGIKHSLTIKEALAFGATVTCSSGDKLIGGPQAGIICGDPAVVKAIRKSPFARMFRVDKLTLSGIEATLQEFVNGSYEQTIPLYQMLSKTVEQLQADAELLQSNLATCQSSVSVVASTAYIGGGTLPAEELPSVALAVAVGKNIEVVAQKLRLHVPPLFCRIEEGALLFDMRTLLDGDLDTLCRELPQLLC